MITATDRQTLAGELIGVAEIAEIMGVPRGSARAYACGAKLPSGFGPFPDPVAELLMGKVWLRSEVEAWLEERI